MVVDGHYHLGQFCLGGRHPHDIIERGVIRTFGLVRSMGSRRVISRGTGKSPKFWKFASTSVFCESSREEVSGPQSGKGVSDRAPTRPSIRHDSIENRESLAGGPRPLAAGPASVYGSIINVVVTIVIDVGE